MDPNQQPPSRDDSEPFVDVDIARERPQRIDRLAEQPDTGELTETDADTSLQSDDDDADIVPGDKTDIYERGTIILPPS